MGRSRTHEVIPVKLFERTVGLVLGLLGALTSSACQGCGKSLVPNDASLAPLEEIPLAERQFVSIRAPLGATNARQVLLLFATNKEQCQSWEPRQVEQRFVVCVAGPPAQSEALARRALVDLKKGYGAYVRSAPVLLVALEGRDELGRALLLEEPGFFSDVILYSPAVEPLTSTSLYGFAKQGGRALAVVSADTTSLDRLHASLRSQAIHFERIPPGADARKRALALVKPAAEPPLALGK